MDDVHRSTVQDRFGHWAAYASSLCAFLFSVPNLYWAFGGTFGLNTIGEWAVQMSANRDPLAALIVGVTGVLKVMGGVYSLALVQTWGRVIPQPLMLVLGWMTALVLVLYGGLQIGVQSLVVVGVIQAPDNVDWWAFYWHLFLWSPWFLIWGILLGLAVLRYHTESRETRNP